MKILKIIAILATGILSLFTAVYFTELYAAEASAKEKTLAEAILQAQLQEQIEKAEQEAAEELGEALVTTVLETKPVTVTTTTTAATTTTTTTVITTTTSLTTIPATIPPATTTEAEEEIITEFTRGGLLPADRTNVPIRTIFTLNEGENTRMMRYLVEHYFLDGTVYAQRETRPALKEKKLLAEKMQACNIKALNLVMNSLSLSDITSILTKDYDPVKSEVSAIRAEFVKNYSSVHEQGEDFAALYDEGLAFFDRLIKALDKFDYAAEEYNSITNPFLAAILAAGTVEDVLLPEIMGVLEQSFDLVETCQEIFLEGTQGAKLLTRDEVRDIVINPGLVVNTGLA